MEIKTLLSLLGGFLLLALILFIHRKRKRKGGEELSIKRLMDNADSWGKPTASACGSCAVKGSCAAHGAKTTIQKKKAIEYYDDQELDLYAGRDSHSYSQEEQAEFQEVYNTLMACDRKGWIESLKLRGIALPALLQQEIEKDPQLRHLLIH